MEKLLLKEEEEEEEVFGPRKESDESYDPANKKNCSGRKLYSGVIEKFQRGDGGFSALWKRRWVVVEKGASSFAPGTPLNFVFSVSMRVESKSWISLCAFQWDSER